jgi:hypothetical protein
VMWWFLVEYKLSPRKSENQLRKKTEECVCVWGEGYDVQKERNVGCHLLTDSITTVWQT